MENYKKISNNLMWVCAMSIIAYFIFLPLNYNRPNPIQKSPSEEKIGLPLEANPLYLFKEEEEIKQIITTTSTATPEFPRALTPTIE
ncbi:MAG: hypothetical protein KatS3mg094_293 [Candidatus Parcubacteria bacterium]|nr:MAG: hypothetical protein KatS3mg094_293 [Candidatus Parcubacteria bacterium]